MPDPIPSDDLYARLGVAREADTPAIDRAWRTLLKQHHPDVAGAVSLQLAKLINVAHDWLSHPERRARYDAAIRQREGRRATGSTRAARPTTSARPGRARRAQSTHAETHAPPDDLDDVFGASAPMVRSFFAQASDLAADDVDRLSVSETAVPESELRAVVPAELWIRIDAIDARLSAVLPASVLADPQALASARSYGRAVVLELFLWFYLADAEPLLEQMRRGWESSVGLPRYGPNTDEVRALIARLARATPAEAEALADAWDRLGEGNPWPADAWEFDFAAFEVSTALARRDAAEALPVGVGAGAEGRARLRDAFSNTAHVVTLRPIFPPRAFTRFQQAWDATGGPAARLDRRAPRPTVRRA